jgi:glutamate:Na+ symporter, ESS family
MPDELVHAILAQTTGPTTKGSSLVVGPFTLLLLAIPVLLLGEMLIRRLGWLSRSNIPAPIIGGLIVAVSLLALNELRPGTLAFHDKTTAAAWLWPVLPQWHVGPASPTGVERPLLILFFTCIGLNASWAVAKKGSWQLGWYLLIATVFAVIMNVVGVLTAKAIGEDPLLGVMCSGVSLMGGFGTAAAFAPDFEQAGLQNAATIGIAAAAFGVIGGGLIAGPLVGRLIRKHVDFNAENAADRGFEVVTGTVAASDASPASPVLAAIAEPDRVGHDGGFVDDVRTMISHAPSVLIHLAVLLVSLKLGAFVSKFIQDAGAIFPVYMGSMLVAALFRNLHDVAGGTFLKSVRVDLIASFALAWLLSVVMINLKLAELVHSALPMFVLLVVQAALIAAFAYWVVFPAMGKDYEAGAMSAGFIGFALGATSNAVATMRQLARRFGPAPRAFLIVTVVGGFLIDLTNALILAGFLNVFRH